MAETKFIVDINTMKIHHNLPPITLPSIEMAYNYG